MKTLLGWLLVIAFILAFTWGFAWVLTEDADARPTEYFATSTAYCLRGKMADGSGTRWRSVASNRHPLGTRIRLTSRPGPGGLRRFVVRDRIGHGSDLDIWLPSCSWAMSWGRRPVTYKIGWGKP